MVAALVVATIYSTLGLARTLSDELRRRSLFDALFGFALVVLLIALVAIARRARLGGREIGLLLGLVAVWVMVVARMAIPEERTHLIEYALLAGLVQQALVERQRNGRFAGRPALAAFAVASTAGIVDELIQAVLPSRVFDARDIGFNVLAAGLGAATMAVLSTADDSGTE